MLGLNEIKTGKVLTINSQPYVVVRTDHHKMGRGGAVLKVKLKNLIDGNMLDKTFQGNDKAQDADTQRKKANYLYRDDHEAYFMDGESFEQFSFAFDQIGDKDRYLKDGVEVDVLYFEGRPVAIDLPIKMKFKVIQAPPSIKGNSVGNVTKQVEIETGAMITAPVFIEEGEEIVINTESGEYVERA